MLNYQHLLYSRSLTKDYRWMVIPQWSSADDLIKLKELFERYDVYKDKKAFSEAEIKSIYCLRLSNMVAFVRCCSSEHQDSYGRQIYCLQGIGVQLKYDRHFWFALPWLLAEHMFFLDVWRNTDFQSADELFKTTSKNFELDLNFRELPFMDQFSELPENSLSENQTSLSFDQNGFKQLLRFISSPNTPAVDFAFGVVPEMLQVFKSFKIIASLQNRPGFWKP